MLRRLWRVGCLTGALGVVTLVACGDGNDRQVCTGDACLGSTVASGPSTTSSGTGGSGPVAGAISWGIIGEGNDGEQKVACTAQDAAGNIYLGGYVEGAVGLGLGLGANAGSADTFLVKLAPDGTPLWGFTFGVAARMEPTQHCGLAVNGNDVYFGADIAGSTSQDATFGVEGAMQGTQTPDDNVDLPVIVKLDGDGNYLNHTVFGSGAAFPWIEGLAVDDTGVYVTGTFGEYQGNTFITTPVADASYSIYVGKFDGNLDNALWSKAYPADANTGLTSVGIAVSETEVVTVGTFDATNLDVDGQQLVTDGARDVVVIKHDKATGDVLGIKQFTGTANQDGMDVAMLGADVLVAGYFETGISFGPNDFVAASTTADPFVVRLGSDLEPVWVQTYEGMGTNQMRQVEVMAGRVFVGGRYQGDIDFGAGVQTGQSNNFFVGELNPETGGIVWSVTSAPDANLNLYTMSVSPVGVAFAGSMTGTQQQPWTVNGVQLIPQIDNVLSIFAGFVPIP